MPVDLRDYVLRRADADDKLSEQGKLVVLAAFEGDDALAEVLNEGATPKKLVDALTAPAADATPPVGAYLTSIAVQGFRGIGAKVTVPLQPGPGLVVIAGRNGSGKSTLAEGLEIALTGFNSRWTGKNQVWSQTWRNLHAADHALIRIGLAEEGSGETTLGVDWPQGDVPVDDLKRWVQRAGKKREDHDVLGWAGALEMYRPMLSYDELSGILEGNRAAFYDELYKLLGLEALNVAMNSLEVQVKSLKEPAAAARKSRDALKTRLAAADDPRAAQALALVAKTKPVLDQVRPLITQGAAATAPAAWRQATGLTTPDSDVVAAACRVVREAAAQEVEASRSSDVLAADRVKVLETALAFREKHGTQPCPVCFESTLDDDWLRRATQAHRKEQQAAQALTAARSASYRTRQALLNLVKEVSPPPVEDAGLTTVGAARLANQGFSITPDDGDLALADHVEAKLPALQTAYAALCDEAAGLISARDDAWSPLAVERAAWLEKAELSAKSAPTLKLASEALTWLQENADVLRNERIQPLADEAKKIWAALRQESNVELGGIKLLGKKNTRHVYLAAGVDGSDTEALGVMSQGELQALALAIFIPRATSEQSPFRFVVLDDPIQAMDPSKIEGFLSVLTDIATERQVIVFTHDDRLPAAIRRSGAPARLIEVTRSANSVVTIDESSNPANRALDDATAIAYDEGVPDDIKKRSVPQLCRDALELTAWDVYSARALADGVSRPEAESAWEAAKKTRARLTLALGGADSAVEAWLGNWSARKTALWVVTKGVHTGVDDYSDAVKATRIAVDDLAKSAR